MPHGNIYYNQIRETCRHGDGSQFQMAGGGVKTAGHILIYDANGNAIDGGVPGSGGGGAQSIYPGLPASDAIPDFSTWTAVNGISLESQIGGAGFPALFKIPENASLNWRIAVTNVPSTPYSVIARLPSLQDFKETASDVGLYFYDGTKVMGLEQLYLTISDPGTSPRPGIRVQKITNVNTDNSMAAALQGPTQGGFFRIAQDSAKMYFYFSLDGLNWIPVFSENTGTFMTPTKIGVGGIALGSNNRPVYMSVNYWRQTGSAT